MFIFTDEQDHTSTDCKLKIRKNLVSAKNISKIFLVFQLLRFCFNSNIPRSHAMLQMWIPGPLYIFPNMESITYHIILDRFKISLLNTSAFIIAFLLKIGTEIKS